MKEKHFILINPELDHEKHNKEDPVLVRKNYIEQTVNALRHIGQAKIRSYSFTPGRRYLRRRYYSH